VCDYTKHKCIEVEKDSATITYTIIKEELDYFHNINPCIII